MPATKKDLSKKYICPLESFGCKGIWTDNVWTYNKHCFDSDTHKRAFEKKKMELEKREDK